MFSTIKIAGLSAILAAGVVAALDFPQASAAAPVPTKAFNDRLAQADAATVPAQRVRIATQAMAETSPASTAGSKGDRLVTAAADCAGQAWPNIARDCLAPADGTPARKVVRMITVETREAGNTSVLARLPVEFAGR
jgi:hypothetical protein